MSTPLLLAPRARFGADAFGPRIVIPALRVWPVPIFLGIWLCGWAAGEVSAVRTLLRGGAFVPGQLFMLVWVAGWTVGGGFALLGLAYMIAGREVISVARGNLVLRWEVLGIGRSKVFELGRISNLRVASAAAEADPSVRRAARGGVVPRLGSVAFDYRGATQRCGMLLDEDDARRVVEEIGRYLMH